MAEDRISGTRRWRATAETWFTKAAWRIRTLGEHENEHVRIVAGWEAAHLLGKVLNDAPLVVPLIEDDLIGDIEQTAKELVAALRAHRLAGKLEQTGGRTPEETEAFQAKAAELRRR